VQNARVYLTITSTADHATDLGFLLHKHPGRAQSFEVAAGTAHVFYPEATEQRCTAALLLEVDPIALVRGRRFGGDTFSLSQYVNDRPYAASSMLAVALGKVFRTAMAGRCVARPDLPGLGLPLEIHVPALPSVGGLDLVSRFFEPLGWAVEVTSIPLDLSIPTWGDSEYVDLRLRGTMPLSQALSHLYVLLPVLDNAKHYWVTSDEVDKLVRAGSGWLQEHPERDLIARRYLAHQQDLVISAVGRLAGIDDALPESLDNAVLDNAVLDNAVLDNAVLDNAVLDNAAADSATDARAARPRPLVEHRRLAVAAVLKRAGASRVVDLGCGEGRLIRDLLQDASFSEILGVDVSHRALAVAERRLRLDRLPDSQRARLTLLQSSVTYRDDRLAGFDAVVLMEVIEHLDLPRLPSLERTVFAQARPKTVVVTTPNAEHNVRYESLAAGTMRHRDHRFEWTRAELADWANRIAAHHGYTVRFEPIGEDDPQVGPPTQMAVFTRTDLLTDNDSHAKAAS
jgi:3' terminal RNA ribose 2'-O-methyltransferase Hen1